MAQENTIPPDKTNLGSFGMLGDKNQEVVQKIVIDDALSCATAKRKPASNDWKIGDVLCLVHGHDLDGEGRREAHQAGARRDRRGEDDRRRREAVRQSPASRRRRWWPRRRRRCRALLARTADRSAKQQDGHSLSESGRARPQSRRLPRTNRRAQTNAAPTTSTTSRAHWC